MKHPHVSKIVIALVSLVLVTAQPCFAGGGNDGNTPEIQEIEMTFAKPLQNGTEAQATITTMPLQTSDDYARAEKLIETKLEEEQQRNPDVTLNSIIADGNSQDLKLIQNASKNSKKLFLRQTRIPETWREKSKIAAEKLMSLGENQKYVAIIRGSVSFSASFLGVFVLGGVTPTLAAAISTGIVDAIFGAGSGAVAYWNPKLPWNRENVSLPIKVVSWWATESLFLEAGELGMRLLNWATHSHTFDLMPHSHIWFGLAVVSTLSQGLYDFAIGKQFADDNTSHPDRAEQNRGMLNLRAMAASFASVALATAQLAGWKFSHDGFIAYGISGAVYFVYAYWDETKNIPRKISAFLKSMKPRQPQLVENTEPVCEKLSTL